MHMHLQADLTELDVLHVTDSIARDPTTGSGTIKSEAKTEDGEPEAEPKFAEPNIWKEWPTMKDVPWNKTAGNLWQVYAVTWPHVHPAEGRVHGRITMAALRKMMGLSEDTLKRIFDEAKNRLDEVVHITFIGPNGNLERKWTASTQVRPEKVKFGGTYYTQVTIKASAEAKLERHYNETLHDMDWYN
jgi:hypothetical protein